MSQDKPDMVFVTTHSKYNSAQVSYLQKTMQRAKGYQWLCQYSRTWYGRWKSLTFFPTILLNLAGTILNAEQPGNSGSEEDIRSREALRLGNMVIMILSSAMVTITNFMKLSEKVDYFSTKRIKYFKLSQMITTELSTPDEKRSSKEFIEEVRTLNEALEEQDDFPYPERSIKGYITYVSRKSSSTPIALPPICGNVFDDVIMDQVVVSLDKDGNKVETVPTVIQGEVGSGARMIQEGGSEVIEIPSDD